MKRLYDIKLHGAFRENSTVVKIEDGETVTVHEKGGIIVKLVGPAHAIMDIYRVTEDGIIGNVRQLLSGTEFVHTVGIPTAEYIRKTLRGFAVHGKYKDPLSGGIITTGYYTPDGELDATTRASQLKTPGGFIPLVKPGQIAVEAMKVGLPNQYTSWVILNMEDGRVEPISREEVENLVHE